MRYTTTDGPKKPLNAIQDGSLGGKMGIAVVRYLLFDPDLFRISRRVQDGKNKNERERKVEPVHEFLLSVQVFYQSVVAWHQKLHPCSADPVRRMHRLTPRTRPGAGHCG